MKNPQNSTPRFTLILGGIFIAVVLIVGGYLLLNKMDDRATYQGPRENITIGAGQGAFLIWIAEDQGYFQDAGLNADIRLYKSGKAAANGMSTGEVDVATSAGFVLVKKSFKEHDIRVIASIKRGYTIRLIARRDHGINAPSDLKGKSIGATLGSASEFFLGRFLIFNDLELGDVDVVAKSPKEMSNALINGEIDAAFTWEPHIYNAQRELGEKAFVTTGQGKQEFFTLLLSKDSWIQAHPSTVKRMLNALVRAQSFAKDNPEMVNAIIQKKFKYDLSYLAYVGSLQVHDVELPQSLITLLEDQARWAINNGIVESEKFPNYMNYIYLEGLDAVKPEVVKVIR